MAKRFEDQVVVITGAATGIGDTTAVRFASEGARVACLDIETTENAAAGEAAGEHGVETLALTCDVRSRANEEKAFAAVIDRWGRIDVLVASAGIYVGGPLRDVPPSAGRTSSRSTSRAFRWRTASSPPETEMGATTQSQSGEKAASPVSM